MPRYPENFAWAREILKLKGIERLHGSHRYVSKDRKGVMPATITGNWQLPNLGAFTTYEFQKHNNVYGAHITADQWRTAVEFLAYQGFAYDPKWKRWRKR
jgi:hypothetical protein